MTAAAFSPRLTRMLEIVGGCSLFFMVGSGLFYQFMGWNLGGSDLVVVVLSSASTSIFFGPNSDRYQIVSTNWKRGLQR
jgi:Kef-type K+ transport system membrane component KefB